MARWTKLFWNSDAVKEVTAEYREKMAAVDAKAAVQEAERIAAKAALQEETEKAFRENNRKLKEAWSK